MNDRELQQCVIDELEFDPSIDSANIGVTASAGVVTLTGHVSAYIQKLAAERAAWRVKGVRGIAQEIEVRLPADKKTHDDEIAQRVVNVIAWTVPAVADAIKVRVSEGYVTVSGKVRWHFQRKAVESAIGRLSGVAGIINQIGLEPEATQADVESRIAKALQRQAVVEAERIRVSIHEGRVSLDGEVDNWGERMAVEQAAWAAPGVHSVEDHLRIA
jgi:osmotically-inducible protein OsmY